MKRIASILICFNLSVFSAFADSSNTIVRIGIIQHFGKNTNDILNIQTTSPSDELEINFPKSSDQTDFKETLKTNTKTFQVKTSLFPSPENTKESSKVIAGAYRTFETASYWADNLKDKFPDEEWQIVYPSPWQIWAKTDRPQQLMEGLYKENFSSAWIQEKLKMRKVLTWIEKRPEEHYSFHRRKLLIKSRDKQAIKIGNKIYTGIIEISPDSFGTYSVINEINLEEYLRGVIPFEIGANSPKAALETQAILSRTYTLANLHRFLPENYNLCATQDCQVYGGLGSSNKNIDEAIKNTKGIVLKNKNNQIAQIFYYSTDGGFSANYDDIWQGNMIGLKGVNTCANLPDQFDLSKEEEAYLFLTSPEAKNSWNCYDAVSPSFRWETKIQLSEITQKMKKAKERWKFAWSNFNEIKDIKVQKRSSTGRVLELLIITDNGDFTIEKDEVRAALGGLKSSFFVIEKINENNNITFSIKGAGFGHGVGLSQFGARTLASQGMPFENIIKTYFPYYHLSQI